MMRAALSSTEAVIHQQRCSVLDVSRRHRFYKPILHRGLNLWRKRMGHIHPQPAVFQYRRTPTDPKPKLEESYNNYFGRSRIWNPIPSKVGVLNQKARDFGWPHRRPPPTGLRRSEEYFPFFFAKYFPDVECRLVVDTVLNNETTTPEFLFPPTMSKQEITNYLRNIYGFDNIVHVKTRNIPHRKFKNEVGTIKTTEPLKRATVVLDAPIKIDFKAIKGTEDTPDNKPQLSMPS